MHVPQHSGQLQISSTPKSASPKFGRVFQAARERGCGEELLLSGRCCLRRCCPCLVRGLGVGFGSTRLLGVGVAATSVRMVRFPPTPILQFSAPRISTDSFPADQLLS